MVLIEEPVTKSKTKTTTSGHWGALTVRGHSPPDDFIEPGEWSEPEWEWEQWNVHLPPWAREEETSFGEALVYQVAMLAAAHQRLAAAVERLGSPPTQETQVGSKP